MRLAASGSLRPAGRPSVPAPRPGGGGTGTLVADLKEELEKLPASRAAALRVVQVVDDPATGAADVAKAASADPALTARVLRVANSAYYGLSGRIGTPAFAVTVVGFATVRSLAAMSASGLADPESTSPEFWTRAAAVASGASLLARRVGADAPEAFCAGLLHDLGSALLRQRAREEHDALIARALEGEDLLELERVTYGGTHASLCADVLAAWRFPSELCDAIGKHHEPPQRSAPPVRRALQGALALVPEVAGGADVSAALSAAHVAAEELEDLQRQIADAAEQLAVAFNA
jgi:putative nucleotidyltransferase with HDIG domain